MQPRLVVEKIVLRGSARLEKIDYPLHLGLMVRHVGKTAHRIKRTQLVFSPRNRQGDGPQAKGRFSRKARNRVRQSLSVHDSTREILVELKIVKQPSHRSPKWGGKFGTFGCPTLSSCPTACGFLEKISRDAESLLSGERAPARGRSAQDCLEGIGDAFLFVCQVRLFQDPLGQVAGGLHKGDVVHQGKGLQGGDGLILANDAYFAFGRIEGKHGEAEWCGQ